MRALVGRKLGMTEIFAKDGAMRAVTLVAAGPCTVTQVRTQEKDGYVAVQIGFGEAKKLKKPQAGHAKASGAKPDVLREVELELSAEEGEEPKPVKVGDKLDVSLFEVG